MSPRARSALVIASVGAVLVPGAALAQTQDAGTSITQGQQTAPERFLNFGQPNQQDLGIATRGNAFNPTGVNYSDCISDMTLGFPVILSGFGVGGNNDAMQIWATANGSCTFDMDRGVGGTASCWLVNNGFAAGTPANGSQEFYVRVQDLVGPQQAPPNPPMGVVHEDASACSAQASFAAVPITLWFVPLSSEGTFDRNAAALSWTVGTDLVGPPAPTGLTVSAGQMLLIAQWTANADSDTTGYNVFIDPPPGPAAQMAQTTKVVCPSSSSSSSASSSPTSGSSGEDAETGSVDATSVEGAGAADVTSDESADAADVTSDESADAADAITASSSSPPDSSASSTSSSSISSSSGSNAADAGCHTVNVVAVPPSPNLCSSAVLGTAMPADSGAQSPEDDAASDDAGVAEGVGGIATIPCQYAVDVGCPAGSPIYTETTQATVTGETTTSEQITGLTDGVTYAVAVSAVDSYGNPGPSSSPECNFPAPIVDFYDIYRDAGGQAGGGFCALGGGTKLEASSDLPVGSWIAFGTAGVAVLAAGRRRRRRASRTR